VAGKRVFNHRIVVAEPESRFASPRVAALYTWWRAAGAGGLPLRRQFDIVEHRRLAPYLFLVEREAGGWRFKIQGESVIAALGVNEMGMAVRDVGGASYGEALEAYYDTLAADRLPRTCTGQLAAYGRDFQRFESIDCPLSREGGAVDFILGVMDTAL